MDTNWHALPVAEAAGALQVDPRRGLTPEHVQERLKQHGPNAIGQQSRWRSLRTVLVQLSSPLVFVLLVAGVATTLLHEWLDTIVIAVALLVNLVVGVVQEGRASKVFETLLASQESDATVLRNGTKKIVPASQLVPGDVVFLEGGSAVPADLRLITAKNLTVNEAALTGEWVPLPKNIHPVDAGKRVNERANMAWSGTAVVTGSGTGIVVATGAKTAFGQIAHDTQEIAGTATPLQKGVQHVARIMTMVIGAAVVAIVVLGLARGEGLAEMALIAIAVAVAAIPSGLPAAVTVVLAIGMESILRKGGLVRSLLAAETLGSTTFILTDKTGTLTEGVMTVSELYSARSMQTKDTTAVHDDNRALLEAAVLSSDAFVVHDEEGNLRVHGRPIERAIVSAGLDASISQQELFAHGNERLDFLQFESARRYSASLNSHPKSNRIYIAGSPEMLLAVSARVFAGGVEREMDTETRKQFERVQHHESARGRRFIGIAYRSVQGDDIPEDIEKGEKPQRLVFMGLMAFSDKVRADVAEEIAIAKAAGMRVVVVTGDYPETARAVAIETGIAQEGDETVVGVAIADMTDEQLLQTLRKKCIFARVLPDQKLRIAHVLKSAGEVVAMTGDGVNDAPALVSADIGVAVGSGTDVAKEASDIVLLNNTFSTITAAIREGRRAVDNLRKIVAYLLSTSFSEVIVIGGSLAAGAPLPLLPTQILWANLVEEGFMSFPFAFEPAEKGIMKRPPNQGGRRVITKQIRKMIITVTAVTGALLLGLYFFLYQMELPIEEIRTVMFVALSLDSIFFALSFKDLHKPVWRIPLWNNQWLFGGLIVSTGLLIAALTFPPLQLLLSLTPLHAWEVGLLALLGLVNLLTIELAKRFIH